MRDVQLLQHTVTVRRYPPLIVPFLENMTVRWFETVQKKCTISFIFQKKCTVQNCFTNSAHLGKKNMESPTAVSTEPSAPLTGLADIENVKALLDTVNSDIESLAE
mgnify:CR=1 FL=1